jgi:hypothetical protein
MSGRFAKAFGVARGWASAAAQPLVGGADFTLSNALVTTSWDRAVIGELIPQNAPAGAFFVLVDEAAGLAVENG